jgi:hypothetical protein
MSVSAIEPSISSMLRTTFGSNFPSIKNGEIPSKHFCEFVRAAA